ncbi:MAG TPA: YbaK/EbsC family protein [Gemmataceae bacterium]|jgi:Ala-tRNA(Pro) deacylase|nr:YbaK/EbsC family protein [Gemmataceae bacterium]
MKLDDLLSSRHVPYQRLHHEPVYQANRMAQMLHVPGRRVAKSVLLRAGRGYVLAVLPAPYKVDLERMGSELGEDSVNMASESEMDQVFPDCETGAMPPFGSLYHVPTFVDESLVHDTEIIFEAANHKEAIRMNYRDYEELEHPMRRQFALRT